MIEPLLIVQAFMIAAAIVLASWLAWLVFLSLWPWSLIALVCAIAMPIILLWLAAWASGPSHPNPLTRAFRKTASWQKDLF